MRLTIHDVGHGSCISLIHNNNVMLWDCGHKEYNRPSIFLPRLGIRNIHSFFVTNYDEDHISDLPRLRGILYIECLYRNKSIPESHLLSIKRQSGPITYAMESMLDMISTYNCFIENSLEYCFPSVTFNLYCNTYPNFSDTNNLSLVTILNCYGKKFIIPGDIEEQGWNELLYKSHFRRDLEDIDVFIASHHGRESGYFPEIFEYCSPEIIVFSDGPVEYETQKMAKAYGRHARGIVSNQETRYVLSTRNDGDIYWDL